MRELRERVAVVTGSASGIGYALAERFAAEGMRVALADVEEPALEKARRALEAQGAQVIGVPTDVSRAEDVERLARQTLSAFGAVHVVCNNAGVSGTVAATWERTPADWQWVLGVNLWGVIHGVRTFVPTLLEQGDEGHVVNTASVLGLVSLPRCADYAVTKHAVVTLTEALHHELLEQGGRVRASVLCPAWVNTRILDSERNRPGALWPAGLPRAAGAEEVQQAARTLMAASMLPEQVAERVVAAIRARRFWVLTHPDWKERVRTRVEDILAERDPTPLEAF